MGVKETLIGLATSLQIASAAAGELPKQEKPNPIHSPTYTESYPGKDIPRLNEPFITKAGEAIPARLGEPQSIGEKLQHLKARFYASHEYDSVAFKVNPFDGGRRVEHCPETRSQESIYYKRIVDDARKNGEIITGGDSNRISQKIHEDLKERCASEVVYNEAHPGWREKFEAEQKKRQIEEFKETQRAREEFDRKWDAEIGKSK